MELTENQQKAVEFGGRNLVIAACAGSGKTRTLTERVAAMVANGVDPASIFVGTFTKAASNEMAERIREYTDATFGHLGTLHSFGYRVLSEGDDKFSGNRQNGKGSIILPHESKSLIKFLMGEESRFNTIGQDFAGKFDLNAERDHARIYQRVSRLKNDLATPASYGKRTDADPALWEIWQAYENAKQNGIRGPKVTNAHRLYDMDDMLVQAFYLIKSDADILARYRALFAHFLIDEAQDCNAAQYSFIRLLAADADSLTIVGDDDQSIYGFRGARPDEFIATSRDATVIALDTNFRSAPEIVEVAARLIAHNSDRLPKQMRPRDV